MFGRKKRIKQEEDFLTVINCLLEDKNVIGKEREALLKAKDGIKKNKYYPRILAGFEYDLRPLALQSKLSKNVGELYLRAADKSTRDLGWSGLSFINL